MQVDRRRFRLGSWTVLPALNRIQSKAGMIQLEPRVMRMLLFFIEHAGEVISREEILEYVWRDTIVSDDSLTRSVSDLRKLLGDDPQVPRVIETIRSVGYRLVAPVEQLEGRVDLDELTAPVPVRDRSGAQTQEKVAPSNPPARLWRWLTLAAIVVATTSIVFAVSRPSLVPDRAPLNVVPFTSLPGVEKSPALSPGGNMVAFVREDRDTGADDLYMKSTSGERILNLTESLHREHSPSWSPDGERIAYVRTLGDECEVMTVPALGGTPVRLAECVAARNPTLAWSPAGDWIAFTDATSIPGVRAVFFVSPETREQRQATFPEQAEDRYPAFSPDGAQLSFARYRTARAGDLYAVSVSGGEAKRLTWDKHNIVGQVWTPDGNDLLFSSNRSGRRQLWTVASTGGRSEQLTSIPTYDPVMPAFSRKTGDFAFVEWYADYNIWEIPLDADRQQRGEQVSIAASTRWDRDPAYSPTGDRLAFTSNRSGSNELWVGEVRGSNVARLTSFGDGFVSTPRWAHDDEHIVFVRRAGEHTSLYVVSSSSLELRQLTGDEGDDVAPCWSRDGRSIYFGSNRDGLWRVWRVEANGGDAEPISIDGGYAGCESVDGGSLYFTRNDEPGIWRQEFSREEASLVVDGVATDNWGNWSVVEDGIYFLDRSSSGASVLSFFDFAVGESTPLRSLSTAVSPEATVLSIAPDRTSILLTQIDWVEGDIMLVPDFE